MQFRRLIPVPGFLLLSQVTSEQPIRIPDLFSAVVLLYKPARGYIQYTVE